MEQEAKEMWAPALDWFVAPALSEGGMSETKIQVPEGMLKAIRMYRLSPASRKLLEAIRRRPSLRPST